MNNEIIMVTIPYEDYKNLMEADRDYYSLVQDLRLILENKKTDYSKWSKELEFPNLQEDVNKLFKKYYAMQYEERLEMLKKENENNE